MVRERRAKGALEPSSRKPGTREPTSLGAEQGKVTFENV
jgi:hypothetical protein